MRALSLDLRERIVDALASDPLSTYRDIAARFAVSVASVESISRKTRNGQSLTPGVSPGRPPIIAAEEYGAFEALAASRTDWSLQSLSVAWEAQSRKAVSLSTTRRTLHQVRFSFKFKKRAASPASAMKPSAPPFGKP